MTPNPAVCTKDTGLDDVARIMAKFDCGAVPVVVSNADQHMVGVITDRDIVLRTLANEKDPFEMAAGDCMTPDVITVTPETGVQDCADLMRRHQIRRIFVKDQSGRCCGVVAQADLVRHMPEHQAGEVVQEVSQPAGAAF
jgi:CBS domain-containing protein